MSYQARTKIRRATRNSSASRVMIVATAGAACETLEPRTLLSAYRAFEPGNGDGQLQVLTYNRGLSDPTPLTAEETPVDIEKVLFRLLPDRAPTLVTLSNATVPQGSPVETVVGTLSAIDVGGDTVTFTLTDSAGGRFKVIGNELRVADASLVTVPGQYSVTVRATGVLGMSTDQPFTVTVTPTPPELVGITVNDGSAQRSQVKQLTLAFDRMVTLAAGAVTLQRLNTAGSGADDGSPPTDATSALAPPTTPDGGRTWVFTFAADSPFMQTSGGSPTGSLVDGIYTVSVDPTKVLADGVPMAAPASLTFHRLFGDVNGSKNVQALDYNLFRATFGKTPSQPTYDAAFDFDNSGTVNAMDYNQFRSRFGKAFTY
jgi:hypothetical protein